MYYAFAYGYLHMYVDMAIIMCGKTSVVHTYIACTYNCNMYININIHIFVLTICIYICLYIHLHVIYTDCCSAYM